jgi:hypothetical protein
VKDAIAGGGIAAGQTMARELMGVRDDPGYLSEAYLTAWECRVVALQHLGQHGDAAEGFSALAGAHGSVLGENDSRAIRWRNDSGSQFALLGRYDRADADHRYMLAVAAGARPRQHRIQLRLCATRGLIFVHNMRGQYAGAESVARAAIGTAE